ncbi:MAG: tyrosine-type recombinase/integrase [Anaerolineae bacterium]
MSDIPVLRGDISLSGASLLEIALAELERAPLAANTRRGYRSALTDFEAWRDGRRMSKTTLEEYASHLMAKGLKPGTVNHRLAALKWWARRLADLAAEAPTMDPDRRQDLMAQAERAATVRGVRGDSEMVGRHVTDGEIRALLSAALAQDGPTAIRDAAMLALAFGAGLRRSEMCALQLEDVIPLERPLGYDIHVRHAKGGKVRTVALYGGAREYLRDWLQVRGDMPGPLWLVIRKGGEIQPQGIGTQGAYERLRELAQDAGIPPIGWHDARRTLAGNLLEAGADLATVQRILGHSSPVTTSAYDRRPDEARRKALRTVTLPYLAEKKRP